MPKAKELFEKASTILGYDLLDKCKNGPKNVLDSTVRERRRVLCFPAFLRAWVVGCVVACLSLLATGGKKQAVPKTCNETMGPRTHTIAFPRPHAAVSRLQQQQF